MANIKVKDLANCTDNGSFIRDLSEEQINLRGGICVFPTDENSRGCSDVIIDFPRKFYPLKPIRKYK